MSNGEDDRFSPISRITCRDPSMFLASDGSCGASVNVIMGGLGHAVQSLNMDRDLGCPTAVNHF